MAEDKKPALDKETESEINGLALILAFIVIGVILQFFPTYFKSELATAIVKWVFVGIGVLGILGEIVSAEKRKPDIEGYSEFGVGLVFIAAWIISLKWSGLLVVNLLSFLPLFLGAYSLFVGLQKIIYTSRLKNKDSGSNHPSLESIIVFATKAIGLIMVVFQLVKLVFD